jgi:hypothetical protein
LASPIRPTSKPRIKYKFVSRVPALLHLRKNEADFVATILTLPILFFKTMSLGLPTSFLPQRFKTRKSIFLPKEHVSDHEAAF